MFEVYLLVQYPSWQVILTISIIGLLPIVINTVWIFLPYRIKGRTIASNKIATVFFGL